MPVFAFEPAYRAPAVAVFAPAPVAPRVLSSEEKQGRIAELVARHHRWGGASIDTVRDMLAEFRDKNREWRASVDDVEPGMTRGIKTLAYVDQLQWFYITKTDEFKSLKGQLLEACT